MHPESTSKEFKLEDLKVKSGDLKQRLLDQAEDQLAHGVDVRIATHRMDEGNYLGPEDFEESNGYDPAHDKWHMRRVLKNAETLGTTMGADMDVVQAAAILHDMITFKKSGKLGRRETDITAEYIDAWLREINFPEEKIEKVKQVIRESSFYRTYETTDPTEMVTATSKEAEVVFDADKLDQSGTLALMRYAASTFRQGRQIFNLQDPACENHDPDNKKYSLDLCRERSFPLNQILYTEQGRNMAKRRNRFLDKFFIKLKLELRQGEFGPAQAILQYFADAGKKGLQFYHPEDALAEVTIPGGGKRKLEPEKYPVDALLQAAPGRELIQEFIAELKLELDGK